MRGGEEGGGQIHITSWWSLYPVYGTEDLFVQTSQRSFFRFFKDSLRRGGKRERGAKKIVMDSKGCHAIPEERAGGMILTGDWIPSSMTANIL